jgi:glyoxylase-like metal-dependent hydrolase (beta-lactamase superfamily II)
MEIPFKDQFYPLTTVTSGDIQEAAPGVFCVPVQIVNLAFASSLTSGEWVLVDAGMPRSAEFIIRAAEERFGSKRPQAIVLTHGHFDHVGSLIELIEHWDVPVYAHEAELPYLTGKADYPPPDPSVGGGLLSSLSFLFPNEGINLDKHVKALPADGTVPGLEDWKWIVTNGHTPGHVSYFRESDRTLIAGDAFVTVKQESLYKVIVQETELHGPPQYYTPDWDGAREAVRKLTELQPSVAITGHGRPMSGEALRAGLQALSERFDELAIPEHGRYVTR